MKENNFICFENVVNIESSGRINVIGAHIFYNKGFVLTNSIDKKSGLSSTKDEHVTPRNVYGNNYEGKPK